MEEEDEEIPQQYLSDQMRTVEEKIISGKMYLS